MVSDRLKGKAVDVGVLVGTGTYADTGAEVAEVALWNEYGTENIPERPFLRPAMIENSDRYANLLKVAARRVLRGEMREDQVMGIIGTAAVSDVQAKITAVSTPPNADSTIAKKGSANPLIDTGRLRQSIQWEEVDLL